MKNIERMVISAHCDGEVESPWKDDVERRIASDPAWAAEAALHRRLKEALGSSPEPDFSAARDRVLTRLSARTAPVRPFSRSLPLAWVSVAAAALLMVAAGAGFWAGRQSAGPSAAAEVSELQVQVPQQLELKLTGEGQLLMASTLQRTSP